MQVATLFGDNVAPFVSTSVTVNASSESVLPPMEGNDDKTMKYDNTENHMSPSTPLSSFLTAQTSNTSDVSSLVNLASSALAIEQHESQPIKDEADVDVGGENDEEAENHQQDDQQIVPTDENVSRNEETIPNESANTANMTDAHISSLDLREQHDDSQTKVMSSPSPMHLNQSPAYSPNQCQSQSESHTAAAEGQETNIESSSQATSLQFQERFLQHQQQQQHTPTAASAIDSCQIQQQNNEIPSVINPSSNIRETNGCATNNLSDMNDLEAENLVIHRNNHNSSLEGVKKPHDDINGVKRLLEEQSQSEEHFQRQQQQQQIAHEQHQLEYEQQIHQQVAEHISRRTEHSEKEETSKDDTQFHECHHNNLAAVTVDEHIQHQQQMSQQQQQNSNVDDYKLQHVPENLQMMNHLEQQHHQQQQHYQQEQQNMFEQQQQQLYLQHHQDQQQQHVAHQHHQHLQQQHHQQLQHHQQQQEHHHSELMAYLHHQEQQQQQQQQQHHHQQHHHHQQQQQQQHQQHQQALQQAHHVRTYQHYQQQQRMHQLTQLAQHAQPQSPHHQAKNTSMTCIDDLMIDDLQEDPNNRYKLLSPTVKHESQDDGYETSAGDVLTPNSHTSTRHSMTPQHQMQHSVNLVLPKCEDLSSTSASTSGGSGRHPDNGNGPYNFIEDVMSSPSSSNGCLSMVMRQQQNFESPTERRLLMEDNTHHNMPMNVVGNQQQQQIMDSRMQEDQTQAHTVIPSCSVSDNLPTPKKRGRKKKGSDEITVTSSVRTMVDGILKPILPKERKKHDRFNGMPEEEVSKRTLPDHLTDNLDIIIIGINPGLFAAYKGHHYAGPGNHFWKCLYLSGLTHEQMTAEEDYKLLKFGIGFTNMVERATKGSADLTRKEIKEGSRILLEKLKRFRPKIAVFNGKLIFEVFSGKKDFNFGRQQECVEGTDTYMWVMPSSSARCAQLPRAADKVPFYAALKKFRDYLNGLIPHIDDIECVFNDQKSKQCCEADSIGAVGAVNPTSSPFLSPDCLTNENQNIGFNNSNNSTPERNIIPDNVNLNKTNPGSMLEGSPIDSMLTNNNSDSSIGGCGMLTMSSNHLNNGNSIMQHMSCSGQQQQQPEKKKRGRPKKIKGIDGADGDGPAPPKVRNTNSIINNNNNVLNLTLMGGDGGEIPKKKRGRPKKIKSDVAAVNLNHGGTSMPTSNSNYQSNPHQNSIESAAHRDSPNNLVSHQFNSQFNSQQPMQQNQSLFNSPMHSPSNVSSYCPMSLNSPNTPPSGGSSQVYHHQQQQQQQQQQQLLNSQLMSHQNNHNLQQQQHVQQHQLHIPSLIYMHSPNHSLQQSQSQSKSPHYGSSQSDLSTEISAAISSDHLTAETQSTPASAASPAAAIAVDYDRPDSIPNEEHNSAHDLRFTSPNLDQTQMGRGPLTPQQAQHYHNIYQNNPSSNQSYLSSTNNVSNSPGGESSIGSGAHKNDEYIASSRKNTSNSNSTQQKNLQLSDVTSKSLSGLESLVDQIPTMAENDNSTIKSDSNEDFPSPSSGGGGGSGSRGGGSSNSSGGGLGCLYMPSYSSSSSSPSAVAIAAPPPVSPQHYPDPSFSAAANECHSSPNNSNDNGNGNNNLNNYNSITSNFSVSSLTSNNYPSNSYHSNLMASAAASSPHHITSTATGSPMYMDPHPHMAVSPLYHHPYAQHGYGPYTSVGPPPPPPPTLHMPSPNYPYAAYPNTSGYPNSQLPSHSSPAAAYLTSHPSMFDRIKPDIGYGGY